MEEPQPAPIPEEFLLDPLLQVIKQKSFTSKAVERFENFSRQTSSSTYQNSFNTLQKSRSEVLSNRGYKPSDIHNPQAREYLTNLSRRVFHTDENKTKKIDLQKLFTPSTDFEEIKPGKNRKLYASSAFYTPGLHPTVQDQVDLARRISHSLSDISNQKSKGQSMYINRKKRSVKWVHDANGKDISSYEYEGSSKFEDGKEERSEKTEISQSSDPQKLALKFVMNPQGQLRDFSEIEPTIPTIPIMSPEPIINALNSNEKGAELFAKRRKKSDKWIVDETNSEKILKSSKTTKFVEEVSSTQSTIESISKSINDLKPITPVESRPKPKPADQPASAYFAATKLAQSPTIIPFQGSLGGLAYRPRVAQGWNAPPIKLQIEIDALEKMDEDKENTLPQFSVLNQRILDPDTTDEYEDLNQRKCESEPPETIPFPEIPVVSLLVEEPPVAAPLSVQEASLVAPTSVVTPAPAVAPVLKIDPQITATEVVRSLTEEEEEYQKVSVRDLVSTFESFQHKEKVHVNKSRILKEPSTESEISEVPKLIQLFTGQPPPTQTVSEPSTPAASADVPSKAEKKHSVEKVSSETSALKSPDSKLAETISEFESQVQNLFEFKSTSTSAAVQEQSEVQRSYVESSAPLEPLTINTEEPRNDSLFTQPLIKRDGLNNLSPLPYHQNTRPLGVDFSVPEPEPPKPDYSYEAFLKNPPAEAIEIPEVPKALDLGSLTNYNTAPRGWGQAKDYYRPIHLGKKFDNLVFSDF